MPVALRLVPHLRPSFSTEQEPSGQSDASGASAVWTPSKLASMGPCFLPMSVDEALSKLEHPPPGDLIDQTVSRVRNRLLQMAREIALPRHDVGLSAFVLLALVRRCAPVIWIGACRVNLVSDYIRHCAPAGIAGSCTR